MNSTITSVHSHLSVREVINAAVRQGQDYPALVKLEHVLAGIYIWEYFTTLEHEWRFFRGGRSLLSTTWIYSACRLSALIFTVVNLVGLNVTNSIDCNAWIISRFVFAMIAVNSAYLIVIVRISAIWERNLFVVLPIVAVWLASIGFWLHVIVHAVYVPTQGCVWITTTRDRPLPVVVLVAGVVLLATTLVGLAWRGALKWSGLWRTIYLQGVVWLSLAAAIEIPDVVVNFLQLDNAWNQMLRSVELFIIVIGVTRTHSVLSKHGHFSQYSDVSASTSKPSQFDALNIQDPRTAGVTANSVFAMSSLPDHAGNRTDRGQETSITEDSAKITRLGNDIGDLEAGRPAVHVVQGEDLYGGKEKEASQTSL